MKEIHFFKDFKLECAPVKKAQRLEKQKYGSINLYLIIL